METRLVKRDGKVSMDKSFDYLCSLLSNGTYTLKIVRYTKPRTLSQNALMWMWFKCLELESDTGSNKDEFHDYYCAKFLSRQIQMGGKLAWVVGGTSGMNQLQMANFLNKVKADAAIEFGVALPLPGDEHYSTFVDEYQRR